VHPTRRTVLSYLAALGSAASSRSAGALISQDSNSTAKDSAAERDRQIANEHLQRLEGPEFYVAESGNDGNPGTKERPLASLARAQELVRLIDKRGKTPITVWVRQGTYYLQKPLVFEPNDSGTTECPVRYAAYPGEEVTLSGGRRLICRWAPYKDGIMMCTLPRRNGGEEPFTQLFIDGKRQIRARYPKYDSQNPLVWGNGYINVAAAAEPWPPTQFHFDPGTFTKNRWSKPELAIVQMFPLDYWGTLQWQVKDVDWDAHVVKLGWGGFRVNALEFGIAATGLGKSQLYAKESKGDTFHSRFYIENVFEELDSPGEWYLDSDREILYYKPAPGVDLRQAKVEVPLLERVVEFRGSQQCPVKFIHLSGFRIAHTVSTFLKQYEAPSRGDWTIHRGGAILIEGAEDCTIDKCFFDAVGGNGVFINNYNRGVRVYGNKFTESGDSAVCLVGSENLIQGTNHPVPSENLISNNLIHDCGVFGKQIAGVFISVTLRNTISHNLIYNLPRAGICVNDGWGGGHIIEFNEIHDTVRETTDHGPFNSWGRGRFWCFEQNHGDFSHSSGYHENEAGYVFYYPEEDGYITEIRNNYFHEDPSKSMHGMDFDDGSSHYHIHNNLCVGLSMTQSPGDYRTVENNIFVHPSNPPRFWSSYERNHDRFNRNIIVISTNTSNKSGNFYEIGGAPLHGPFVEEMDYNLFFADVGQFSAAYRRREIQTSRYSLEQWQALGYDLHSVFADPMFVDPDKRDYRVKSDSPAIKLGFKNFDLNEVGLLPDFPKQYSD
jgi:hypothetical protein